MPRWALALPVLVVVATTLTAVGLITLGRQAKTPSVSGGTARVGSTAPDFSSWDLNGNPVRLSEFRGRPVLLTFWATWCTACQEELPLWQGIRDRNQSSGFAVLAINYREANHAQMSRFLAGLHVNLETVIDPMGAIASAYGVDVGLPISVLLDRRATVVQILIGRVSGTAMEAAAGKAIGSGASP